MWLYEVGIRFLCGRVWPQYELGRYEMISDVSGTTGKGAFTAPYVSFKTLTNLLEKMGEDGAPQRIDRTYLANLPGSTQSMLLSALDTFGLIDASKQPTDRMKALIAADADELSAKIAELVRAFYGPALNLGDNATQGQLEEVFTEQFNVSGSTRRKAIAFFLAGAKFGGIPVSKHFKTPKVSNTGSGSRSRGGKSPNGAAGGERQTPPPAATDAKARYIDLLLKKAETDDALDSDLLNRIERVIGVEPETSSPEVTKGGE